MPLDALSSVWEATARILPSPLKAVRTPNQSYRLGLEDLINACSVQMFPLRAQTYTPPTEKDCPKPTGAVSTSQSGGLIPGLRHCSSAAPAATVLPSSLMVTEFPRPSFCCD